MFIEPHRAVLDAFERVVDREHGGVGADLSEGAQQRGGREVAGGGDKDLRVKVVARELVFAHTHVGEARAVELVADAAEVIWTGGKP